MYRLEVGASTNLILPGLNCNTSPAFVAGFNPHSDSVPVSPYGHPPLWYPPIPPRPSQHPSNIKANSPHLLHSTCPHNMEDIRLILDSSDHTTPARQFVLPDLVSHCSFALSYHINGDEIAQQSVDWLDLHCPDLSPKQRQALRGLQAGKLTAYCYHTATPERLRVVSDFLSYLFHLCVHDMT